MLHKTEDKEVIGRAKRCSETQRHGEREKGRGGLRGERRAAEMPRERPSPGASGIFGIFQETGGFLFLTTT